jgi:hypothetical protein
MTNVERVFKYLIEQTYDTPDKWLTTVAIGRTMNLPAVKVAQALYLLRANDNIASRISGIGSMYEHRALRKKRKVGAHHSDGAKKNKHTHTRNIIQRRRRGSTPTPDTVDILISAVNDLVGEVQELRQMRNKLNTIFGEDK